MTSNEMMRKCDGMLEKIYFLEDKMNILNEKHKAHEELFMIKIKELEDGINNRSESNEKRVKELEGK